MASDGGLRSIGKLIDVTEDRRFCSSSYLMYRYVYDERKCFDAENPCCPVNMRFGRQPVCDARTLHAALKAEVDNAYADGRAALALSGGIDSAILARLAPRGSKAYTFRCVVPGVQVVDESDQATRWAKANGLEHEIIDITWGDVVTAAEICMHHKGAPVHSIEAQVFIAASRAKGDGVERMVFGENADIIYGGMDGLLAEDWTLGQLVDRYCYVMPWRVLRDWEMPLDPFLKYEQNGHVDGHQFVNEYFRQEALGTYTNACDAAGVDFVGPYSRTVLDTPLDYERIRSGDTKYIVRELFREFYPGEEVPTKIPMPRPTDEWMRDWKGPTRFEFWPHCADGMTGDQRWMVWCLERYLDMQDCGEACGDE